VFCNRVLEKSATCGLSQIFWQVICNKVLEQPATCGLKDVGKLFATRFWRTLLRAAYPKEVGKWFF
jgi:hypothetical protein